jgi:putative ABC transport system permease protein
LETRNPGTIAEPENRAAREAEIIEELEQHLDQRYRDALSAGATPDDAYQAALEELTGSAVMARELWRIERPIHQSTFVVGTGRKRMSDAILRDLHYGTRVLRKNPGFTTIALLSLALGIGANTAIFQLLDAVRLRTLPVVRPQEISLIQIADIKGARGSFDSPYPTVTNPIWEQIRDRQEAFTGVFAWGQDSFNMSEGGEARYAKGLWVSGDFFNVLGVRPIVGRVFTVGDDQRGSPATLAVISAAFWESEFGKDPSIIGRNVTLKGVPFEIIGVTPASFTGLEIGQTFDVAVPVASEGLLWRDGSRLNKGTDWWLTVMGRLKPGWSVEQASAHLASMSAGLFEATLPRNYPRENVNDYLGFTLKAADAGAGVSQIRDTYASPLLLLLVLSGLVLLITCANLANLILARASAREREIAVRLALGASRARLVRQLLSESLLLAALGALLGGLLAQGLSRLLVSLISTEGNPVLLNLELDWRVLAFTGGLAILTCILFGLAPAVRSTRATSGAIIKANSRGLTATRERLGIRRLLVVAQVALSLVLVAGALLFSRSLGNILAVDAGFQQNGVLVTRVALTRLQLPVDQRIPFKRMLLERMRAIPGVDAAADAYVIPLSGNSWNNRVWAEGLDSGGATASYLNRVSADYFRTIGTRLLAGRDFNDTDTETSPRVAVVNETFARQVLNDANPVGRRFWIETTPTVPERIYEIVGLAKDSKYIDLRENFRATAFLPASQDPLPGYFDQILIRSNTGLGELTAAVKSAASEINPQILVEFQALKTQIESSLLRDRLIATLSGFFGGLALVLACIGLYGVMSYGVTQRTHEIGIRMALGAPRRNVLWLVLRDALVMALIGVGVGLPAVLSVTRLTTSLLFGVAPTDPVSIAIAGVMLFAVAGVAGYVPARRATLVDPLVALRYE